jgi:hypothetical protein
MPLTPQREQEIRDEELYRDQVRQSMKRPPNAWDRFNSFFDSRVGFWLLTTVLAGVVATGFTWLQQYNDREKLRAQAEADAARRDMDTLLKVVSLVSWDRSGNTKVAVVLLGALTSKNAVDPDVAKKVQALVEAKLDDVLSAPPTKENEAEVNSLLTALDKQAPTVAAGISNLPIRVYVQIPQGFDREKAGAVADSIRKQNIIVPGIEVVPVRIAPQVFELRYCPQKIQQADLPTVQKVADAVIGQAVKLYPLGDSLCGNVRPNHFELWYPKSAVPGA